MNWVRRAVLVGSMQEGAGEALLPLRSPSCYFTFRKANKQNETLADSFYMKDELRRCGVSRVEFALQFSNVNWLGARVKFRSRLKFELRFKHWSVCRLLKRNDISFKTGLCYHILSLKIEGHHTIFDLTQALNKH